MDPPKEESITIFWIREEYFYVYDIEKKKLCDLHYGPFTSREKAEQAIKDLMNLSEKLKTHLVGTKFFTLFVAKYKSSVCFISSHEVPKACLVLKFPNDSENSEMIFDAIYNPGTNIESRKISLVDPSIYDLAWMKFASLGFFIEDLNKFL